METAIFNSLNSLVHTVLNCLAIASALSACALVCIRRAH